jgi:DNA primase
MANPVEEIKERLNIVEVIQEYVPLKKLGNSYKARCPFHNEKSPSFTVSEEKQFYHCFGCSKGGDVFTFIQEIEGVEFVEALRMLAKKANIELTPVNRKEQNDRTRLLDCLEQAAKFYQEVFASAEGEKARTYIDGRGLDAETIATFQIGYSPEAWDRLLQHLKKHGFTEKEMERAGLILRSAKTGGYYDRFRGRVMFPIYNSHGNVIGFGGRTLDPNPTEAKYINSPQTDLYNKSAALYGLHASKKFIQKMDAAVVVEGYMDVATAYQAKFRNVIAASGTALTHEQIRLLKRLTQNVILSFDSDNAGLSAAWRGMQVAIQEGMNIKVLVLPSGKDPDELIRKDPQAFRDAAINAKPFMDYAFDIVLNPLDLSNVQHKKKAAQELLPMIALFPSAIEKTHYIQQLAKLLDVSEAVLNQTLANAKQRQNTTRQTPVNAPRPVQKPQQKAKLNKGESLSERLIALLAFYPKDFAVVADRMVDGLLVGEPAVSLYKVLENTYNQSGHLSTAEVQFPDAELQSQWHASQISGEELYSEKTEEQKQQELLTLLDNLERYRIQQRLHRVQQQLTMAERQHDTDAIEQLTGEFHELTESLRTLG